MHILNDEKERNLELKGEGLLLVKETSYKKNEVGKILPCSPGMAAGEWTYQLLGI